MNKDVVGKGVELTEEMGDFFGVDGETHKATLLY